MIGLPQAMNEAQRAPYVQMAKDDKMRSKTDPRYYNEGERDILTAQGIPYSQVQKEREAALRKEENMKKRIVEMVTECFMSNSKFGWAISGRTMFNWFQFISAIRKQPFYFMFGSFFCKHMTDGSYLPAEVALTCFNLEDGVQRKYHTFVDPGKKSNRTTLHWIKDNQITSYVV